MSRTFLIKKTQIWRTKNKICLVFYSEFISECIHSHQRLKFNFFNFWYSITRIRSSVNHYFLNWIFFVAVLRHGKNTIKLKKMFCVHLKSCTTTSLFFFPFFFFYVLPCIFSSEHNATAYLYSPQTNNTNVLFRKRTPAA